MEEGIYFGMPAEEYHAAPGLSHSGMRALAISPLEYWHQHLRPGRTPEAPTPAQGFGTALHCRLLEPAEFPRRYARRLNPDDYPDALDTVDDLKAWLQARGQPTTHKRKQELIDRVRGCDPTARIWAEVQAEYVVENHQKELLSDDDWQRLEESASVARADPLIDSVLSDGAAEVSVFVRDPETDVLLKCRLDYLTPQLTVDVKSFSLSRMKSLHRTICDQIYHERYFEQAVFYHDLRALALAKLAAGQIEGHGWADPRLVRAMLAQSNPGFAFVFVESSAPYHLALYTLRREYSGGQSDLYWTEARRRQRQLIGLYQECCAYYGELPWRRPVEAEVLEDTDLPQLAYADAEFSPPFAPPAEVMEASAL